jgi:hypothetical protein
MVRELGVTLAALFLVAACEGDKSVSGVNPQAVFAARTTVVTVSGSGTDWSEGVQVDFGPGITVDDVVVASPTAVVARVTVTSDATLGPRDVTVGGSVYNDGFSVVSPLRVTLQGTMAQGSILLVRLQSLDFSTPFDTTSESLGLFGPFVFPNIVADVPEGVELNVDDVQPYLIDATLYVDVNAPAGVSPLQVLSGPAGQETSFPLPGGLDIAARTPITLVAGAPSNGSIETPYASALYQFTPGAGANVLEMLSSGTGEATPKFALLPSSGRLGGLISYGRTISLLSQSTQPYYLVYWDNTGASGYSFTMLVDETSVTTADEVDTDNETPDTAQVLTAEPYAVKEAALDDADDVDWFRLAVTADDIGKAVHVRTFGGDLFTDTVLQIFGAGGVNDPLSDESPDTGYHENWTSNAITDAGNIYVKVSASPEFDDLETRYVLFVELN